MPNNNHLIKISSHFFWQKKSTILSLNDLPVYVLNLDRVPKRYQSTKKQLDNIGLNHQRFSAVDGYLLKITDDKGNNFNGFDIKTKTYVLKQFGKYTIHCPSGDITYIPDLKKIPLSAGEFGVMCSHREIWYDIVKNSIPNALVFEDDIGFKNKSVLELKKTLTKLPKDYDLLFIHYYIDRIKKGNIINNWYISKVLENKQSDIASTAAYLINLHAANILLNDTIVFDDPVDIFISQRSIGEKHINAYISNKQYVNIRDSEPSTIRDMKALDASIH